MGLQDDAAMVDWVKKNPYLRTQGKEIWQRAVSANVTGHSWHFGCLLFLFFWGNGTSWSQNVTAGANVRQAPDEALHDCTWIDGRERCLKHDIHFQM